MFGRKRNAVLEKGNGTPTDGRRPWPKRMLDRFRYFWLLPLCCAAVWWGVLVALMSIWAAQGYGNHVYPDQTAGTRVPYISDIAASGIKPLFIAGDATQGVFYILAFSAERYLRHRGRLERNHRVAEKVMSGLAIWWCFFGQVGLLMLSIFDTYRNHRGHMINVGLFIIGVGLSAFFSFMEFFMLRKSYREVNWLRFSYLLKAGWLIVAIGLAVAFICLLNRDNGIEDENNDAIIEWTLAYWYGFMLLILACDLYPASKRSQQREHNGGYFFGTAAPVPSDDVEASGADYVAPTSLAPPVAERQGSTSTDETRVSPPLPTTTTKNPTSTTLSSNF
ncbi:Frag1/DRAM/Sfk1 family-domain-containing protein [Limtongia smithiae]|uniref:Frag1/DRAM/Sfk1 family-domain-containing protein n=1 Tax=Limtongia smithiae TaxID=1125753 RepID=UPI0034CF6CA3